LSNQNGFHCLALFLRKQGYRILEAGCGVEALQKLEEHKGDIQLLFSDMMMPG
jgi:CheY-like chemotaxis protein